MNDKIKELAVKAQIYFSYDRGPGTDNELQAAEITQSDLEKFAELIVKECIDMIDLRNRTQFHPTSTGGELLHNVAKDLKQHFGVEE